MLEDFLQKLIDKSALMRAIRMSVRKATLLGVADAIGPGADRTALENGELPEPDTEEPVVTAEKRKEVNGLPLPRPQVLGIATTKTDDEPDQPGVPPKSVRKKRRNDDDRHDSTAPASSETNGQTGAEK